MASVDVRSDWTAALWTAVVIAIFLMASTAGSADVPSLPRSVKNDVLLYALNAKASAPVLLRLPSRDGDVQFEFRPTSAVISSRYELRVNGEQALRQGTGVVSLRGTASPSGASDPRSGTRDRVAAVSLFRDSRGSLSVAGVYRNNGIYYGFSGPVGVRGRSLPVAEYDPAGSAALSCANDDALPPSDVENLLTQRQTRTAASSIVRTVELAVDIDYDLYSRFGENTEDAVNWTLATVANANAIFERDLGLRFSVTAHNVWTSPATNPYTTNQAQALLGQFYLQAPAVFGASPRDISFLFTGRTLEAGIAGIAYMWSMCNSSGVGTQRYLASSQFNSIVLLHEVGHTLGLPHDSVPGSLMQPSLNSTMAQYTPEDISQVTSSLDVFSCLTPAAADSPVEPPLPENPEPPFTEHWNTPGHPDADTVLMSAITPEGERSWTRVTPLGVTELPVFGRPSDIPVFGDFDGDNHVDRGLYDPLRATWTLERSGGDTTAVDFGEARCVPEVLSDYDGDGITDLSCINPAGEIHVRRSSDGREYVIESRKPGAVSLSGDYNGDGRTEAAVYFQGELTILSGSAAAIERTPLGKSGDAAAGVYNGDGDSTSEAWVVKPHSGRWTNGTASQEYPTRTAALPLVVNPRLRAVFSVADGTLTYLYPEGQAVQVPVAGLGLPAPVIQAGAQSALTSGTSRSDLAIVRGRRKRDFVIASPLKTRLVHTTADYLLAAHLGSSATPDIVLVRGRSAQIFSFRTGRTGAYLALPSSALLTAGDFDDSGTVEIGGFDMARQEFIVEPENRDSNAFSAVQCKNVQRAASTDIDGDGYSDPLCVTRDGTIAVFSGRARRLLARIAAPRSLHYIGQGHFFKAPTAAIVVSDGTDVLLLWANQSPVRLDHPFTEGKLRAGDFFTEHHRPAAGIAQFGSRTRKVQFYQP